MCGDESRGNNHNSDETFKTFHLRFDIFSGVGAEGMKAQRVDRESRSSLT